MWVLSMNTFADILDIQTITQYPICLCTSGVQPLLFLFSIVTATVSLLSVFIRCTVVKCYPVIFLCVRQVYTTAQLSISVCTVNINVAVAMHCKKQLFVNFRCPISHTATCTAHFLHLFACICTYTAQSHRYIYTSDVQLLYINNCPFISRGQPHKQLFVYTVCTVATVCLHLAYSHTNCCLFTSGVQPRGTRGPRLVGPLCGARRITRARRSQRCWLPRSTRRMGKNFKSARQNPKRRRNTMLIFSSSQSCVWHLSGNYYRLLFLSQRLAVANFYFIFQTLSDGFDAHRRSFRFRLVIYTYMY
jgi:hypothetical protein